MRARRCDVGGAHADLAARERARRNAALAQRHGEQRDRHLLARSRAARPFRADWVRARCRAARSTSRSVESPIAETTTAMLSPRCAHRGDFFGDALDELDRAHRRAAVLLDDGPVMNQDRSIARRHPDARFAQTNRSVPIFTHRAWSERNFDARERRAERRRDCCRRPARSPDDRRPCRRPGPRRCRRARRP